MSFSSFVNPNESDLIAQLPAARRRDEDFSSRCDPSAGMVTGVDIYLKQIKSLAIFSCQSRFKKHINPVNLLFESWFKMFKITLCIKAAAYPVLIRILSDESQPILHSPARPASQI